MTEMGSQANQTRVPYDATSKRTAERVDSILRRRWGAAPTTEAERRLARDFVAAGDCERSLSGETRKTSRPVSTPLNEMAAFVMGLRVRP